MTFLDLFSGIGGFRLGLELAGHTCIGHVEKDKFCNMSYENIYKPKKEEFYHNDITLLSDDDFRYFRGKCDIITGGFPCQAFSIAGKRRGFEDVRGTMFFYLTNAIKQIKPRYFILENVKNLLSHEQGRTFNTIITTLHDIGYSLQWQVLNSKDFGVPQNRERVYIIGHLRGERRPEIFFVEEKNEGFNRERIKCVGSTKEKNKNSTGRRQEVYSSKGIIGCLTATDYKQPKQVGILKQVIPGKQGERVYSANGISCTIMSSGGGEGAKTGLYILPILTPERIKKRQNGRRIKGNKEPMFAITSQDKHGIIIQNGNHWEIRRLTPRECFRLQGFPDWAFERACYGQEIPNEYKEALKNRSMTKEAYKDYYRITKKQIISDSQLYKQAGNAVTVNVVRWIGEQLKQYE